MTASKSDADCLPPLLATDHPSARGGVAIQVPQAEPHRIAREDVVPVVGRRLIVRCDQPNCAHAAIIDPRRVFGSARDWPGRGRSKRFRCVCGSRRSLIDYTSNADARDGPIEVASLALWF
jgi:hypothetical protein